MPNSEEVKNKLHLHELILFHLIDRFMFVSKCVCLQRSSMEAIWPLLVMYSFSVHYIMEPNNTTSNGPSSKVKQNQLFNKRVGQKWDYK